MQSAGCEGDRKIKAFIVDDSPMMCRVMEKILGKDPDIEVLGHALSGQEALAFLASHACDLCTLDVHMPGMNGLTVLKHIMIRYPVPTLMVSAFTGDGSRVTFEALRYGAVDFFQKPTGGGGEDLEAQAELLRIKAKRAARVQLEAARYLRIRPRGCVSKGSGSRSLEADEGLVIINASTGGYAALLSLVPMISPDLKVPVIVTLGTQSKYIRAFTDYLRSYAQVEVTGLEGTQELRSGTIYMVGEEQSIGLKREGDTLRMSLGQRSDLSAEEGAIDLLLLSASEVVGTGVLCAFLSGDGTKGLTGAREISRTNGRIMVQKPETCLAPELPRKILQELGAEACSLRDLAAFVSRWRE